MNHEKQRDKHVDMVGASAHTVTPAKRKSKLITVDVFITQIKDHKNSPGTMEHACFVMFCRWISKKNGFQV